MTPAEVQQAASLLANLAALQAQLAAFQNATSFTITAIGSGGILGSPATFPASVYEAQVALAFNALISDVTSQLTALGVTGL